MGRKEWEDATISMDWEVPMYLSMGGVFNVWCVKACESH